MAFRWTPQGCTDVPVINSLFRNMHVITYTLYHSEFHVTGSSCDVVHTASHRTVTNQKIFAHADISSFRFTGAQILGRAFLP